MELKTKTQYTYFIYPYIVKEKEYEKYLQNLLLNPKFTLKIFDREKDMDLYTYFLPKVRDNLFWSFKYSKYKINKLNEMEDGIRTKLIKEYPCSIFEYKLNNDIQGKTGKADGIYFNISKLELICFNSGICFLLMKTNLDSENKLSDLCNFNYKFRDIKSDLYDYSGYENIKIQTDMFNNIKEIDLLIREITGKNQDAKKLNLSDERFITYTYACVEQEEFENEENKEILEKEFYKLANVEKEDYIIDFENTRITDKMEILKKSKSEVYGCSKIGTVLLTTDKNTENYTMLPYKFERQYLYQYIYQLYKKIYLKKINRKFDSLNNINNTKNEFLNFTREIWIEEITNDTIGNLLDTAWSKILNLQNIYFEVKNGYDIAYKNFNIRKGSASNKFMGFAVFLLIILNIIVLFNLK